MLDIDRAQHNGQFKLRGNTCEHGHMRKQLVMPDRAHTSILVRLIVDQSEYCILGRQQRVGTGVADRVTSDMAGPGGVAWKKSFSGQRLFYPLVWYQPN